MDSFHGIDYSRDYNSAFMQFLESSLVELITQTATNLPPDVRAGDGRGRPR